MIYTEEDCLISNDFAGKRSLTVLSLGRNTPEREIRAILDNKKTPLSTFDVLVELVTLIFTIVDMSFVAILVVRHYSAEVALEAWAMLLPVFLSTFGMQLFFEKYPPEKHWYNEILNIPLIGSIFCSAELLYSKIKAMENENLRHEAESVKLKQYETIFRAFPEGVIMLSVVLINQDEEPSHFIQSWIMEIICVAFAVISLAECHWYGCLSDYYRIMDKTRQNREKTTLEILEEMDIPNQIHFWQKTILFFHSIFCIGFCILAEALLRVAVYAILNRPGSDQSFFDVNPKHSFAEVMFIVFFSEIAIRTILHMGVQLVKHLSYEFFHYCLNPFHATEPHVITDFDHDSRILKHKDLGGIHGALKDGALSTFSPLGYQSKYLPAILWFYVQNLIFILLWFVTVKFIEFDSGVRFEKYGWEIFYTAIFLFCVSSILQVVSAHLTHPQSDEICIVRIHKVPHAFEYHPV